jgi:hypothetical protein
MVEEEDMEEADPLSGPMEVPLPAGEPWAVWKDPLLLTDVWLAAAEARFGAGDPGEYLLIFPTIEERIPGALGRLDGAFEVEVGGAGISKAPGMEGRGSTSEGEEGAENTFVGMFTWRADDGLATPPLERKGGLEALERERTGESPPSSSGSSISSSRSPRSSGRGLLPGVGQAFNSGWMEAELFSPREMSFCEFKTPLPRYMSSSVEMMKGLLVSPLGIWVSHVGPMAWR